MRRSNVSSREKVVDVSPNVNLALPRESFNDLFLSVTTLAYFLSLPSSHFNRQF